MAATAFDLIVSCLVCVFPSVTFLAENIFLLLQSVVVSAQVNVAVAPKMCMHVKRERMLDYPKWLSRPVNHTKF